jgi:hypothetical protein
MFQSEMKYKIVEKGEKKIQSLFFNHISTMKNANLGVNRLV